ncbi:MAG TPA: RidA family protein [Terriglobales bacterium]|nr:RidA family protein [Terriglobales bacterium]
MNVEMNHEPSHLLLPPSPQPLGAYVPTMQVGDMLFVSGMLPILNGVPQFVGRIGQDLTVEQGHEAALLAARNAMAAARDAVGLNRLAGVVRLAVHMSCTADFQKHAAVADGASEWLNHVFQGQRHTRVVFGSSSLPAGVAVEIEIIFRIATGEHLHV